MTCKLWQTSRFTANTFGVAALLIMASNANAQAIPHSDSPPARFVRAWQDAIGLPSNTQKAALALLASVVEWEPYFRSAFNATPDQVVRDRLRPALIKCQADLFERNLERADDWAKEFRFDLLTSLTVATDDSDAVAKIGQHLVVAQCAVHDRFKEIGNWANLVPSKAWSFMHRTSFDKIRKTDGFTQVSGDWVSIREEHHPAIIHSRAGEVLGTRAHTWISMSEKQLSERTNRKGVNWQYSVVCVNGDASFRNLYSSLVICDGDVELPSNVLIGESGSSSHSVIIANGNVNSSPDFGLDSFSFVFAAGNYTGRKDITNLRTSVIAGGKNEAIPDFSGPAKESRAFIEKHFKEGVKENPFGVKFVSPADVGVELAIGVKLVRLGTLKESSPLVKAGLEKGDRVLTLNGVTVETAADFRRQLRESLLWGTGLFEIKRGEQTFLRLVKFAEPPKK